MKYLEALLARDAARVEAGGDRPGTPRPAADNTAKSPEATDGTTFVGNVASPLAHDPADRALADGDGRPVAAGEMDAPDLSAWGPEEFQERAAIMEFDGGLDRAEAERRALVEVLGGGRTAGDA